MNQAYTIRHISTRLRNLSFIGKKSINTKKIVVSRHSWIYEMDGWMDGWMDRWMYVCMYVYAQIPYIQTYTHNSTIR